MQEVAIPMLNPYQISKTVRLLIKQAERGPLSSRPTMLEPPMPEKEVPVVIESTGSEAAPVSESTVASTSEPITVKKASEYDVLMTPRPSSTTSTISTQEPTGKCPRCSSPIMDNYHFCPICSKQLKEKYCPGCKREIRPDFQFCPYCGLKL